MRLIFQFLWYMWDTIFPKMALSVEVVLIMLVHVQVSFFWLVGFQLVISILKRVTIWKLIIYWNRTLNWDFEILLDIPLVRGGEVFNWGLSRNLAVDWRNKAQMGEKDNFQYTFDAEKMSWLMANWPLLSQAAVRPGLRYHDSIKARWQRL